MPIRAHLPAAALVVIALFTVPAPARAAESFDGCGGRFINSLPATISSQGVWCLHMDLSTGISSGNAITIATNNVTIDCNHFKLGGLAAGDGSLAIGIGAAVRENVIVRRCNVRGFNAGVFLQGGGGHLVEDNRFDNNLRVGIDVRSDNSRVLRNVVYDTGGALGSNESIGIYGSADIIDNTVDRVFAVVSPSFPKGIQAVGGAGGVVRGNIVRGLVPIGENGYAFGLVATASGMTVDGNRVSAVPGIIGTGIFGFGPTNTFCTHNTVAGFTMGIGDCRPSTTNDSW